MEVALTTENVWLAVDPIAEWFLRNKSTISRHIKNVIEEGLLNKDVVVVNL